MSDVDRCNNGRLRPRKNSIPSSHVQPSRNLRKSSVRQQGGSTQDNETSLPVDNVNASQEQSTSEAVQQKLCLYCERKFPSKRSLSKHVQRIHPTCIDESIKCNFCNHYENEPGHIVAHMLESHWRQYMACADCLVRFSSTEQLYDHICTGEKKLSRKKQRPKNNLQHLSENANEIQNKQNLDRVLTDKILPQSSNLVIPGELISTKKDAIDLEDILSVNLILQSGKNVAKSHVLEKSAVIVLDDIQWKKKTSNNAKTCADRTEQILSRLGVVHRTRAPESTRYKHIEDNTKFERCFDTNFYAKVANNVQENLSKFLDGSFNAIPKDDEPIKTRKSKNNVANTIEGFPTLLAVEQYSRNTVDDYLPRAIAPKQKWNWDNADIEKQTNAVPDIEILKRDSHANNCVVGLFSGLDIWTQLCMRRRFEETHKSAKSIEHNKKLEKQNTSKNELKQIIESRELPNTSTNIVKYTSRSPCSGHRRDFPLALGLVPATSECELEPAVLSGEWARKRCYVCGACGDQNEDPKALAAHDLSSHPHAQVTHYEVVGDDLLSADILKHLYVPPAPPANRSRPVRGSKACTKCKQPLTSNELHQHMLECAGDTPTTRRKCRYRPFGIRRRRSRVPVAEIRKKLREEMRSRRTRTNKLMRARPRIRTTVGDAETIQKMLADLPAKRNRVSANQVNSKTSSRAIIKRDRKITRSKMIDGSSHNYLQAAKNKAFKIAVLRRSQRRISVGEKPTSNIASLGGPMHPSFDSNGSTNVSVMTRSASGGSSAVSGAPMSGSASASSSLSISGGGSASSGLSSNGSSTAGDSEVTGGSSPNSSGNSNNKERSRSISSRNFSQNQGAPNNPVPLKHSIANITSNTSDDTYRSYRFAHLLHETTQQISSHYNEEGRKSLLIQNGPMVEIVKPPLCPQIDILHCTKTKSPKSRKGLNDCIAMLKGKLGSPMVFSRHCSSNEGSLLAAMPLDLSKGSKNEAFVGPQAPLPTSNTTTSNITKPASSIRREASDFSALSLIRSSSDYAPEMTPTSECSTASTSKITCSTATEPIYSTATEPIYSTTTESIFSTATVPIYSTATVPIYSTATVPIYSTATVPIYSTAAEPIYSTPTDPIYLTPTDPIYPSPPMEPESPPNVVIQPNIAKPSIESRETTRRIAEKPSSRLADKTVRHHVFDPTLKIPQYKVRHTDHSKELTTNMESVVSILPQEITEILATMTEQHRNKLLNALPQVFAKTIQGFTNKEPNTSPNRSEIATQTVSAPNVEECPPEFVNVDTDHFLIDPVTGAITERPLSLSQVSEANSGASELHDIIDLTTEDSYSTNDENQFLPPDAPKLIESFQSHTSEHETTLQPLVHIPASPVKIKSPSDKTASLRAVRIKSANEKQKKLTTTDKSKTNVSEPLEKLDSNQVLTQKSNPLSLETLEIIGCKPTFPPAIQQAEISSSQQRTDKVNQRDETACSNHVEETCKSEYVNIETPLTDILVGHIERKSEIQCTIEKTDVKQYSNSCSIMPCEPVACDTPVEKSTAELTNSEINDLHPLQEFENANLGTGDAIAKTEKKTQKKRANIKRTSKQNYIETINNTIEPEKTVCNSPKLSQMLTSEKNKHVDSINETLQVGQISTKKAAKKGSLVRTDVEKNLTTDEILDTSSEGETQAFLLRRSRRGKSSVDDVSSTPSSNLNISNFVTPHTKIPITKKRLIFSKLLEDEEKLQNKDIIKIGTDQSEPHVGNDVLRQSALSLETCNSENAITPKVNSTVCNKKCRKVATTKKPRKTNEDAHNNEANINSEIVLLSSTSEGAATPETEKTAELKKGKKLTCKKMRKSNEQARNKMCMGSSDDLIIPPVDPTNDIKALSHSESEIDEQAINQTCVRADRIISPFVYHLQSDGTHKSQNVSYQHESLSMIDEPKIHQMSVQADRVSLFDPRNYPRRSEGSKRSQKLSSHDECLSVAEAENIDQNNTDLKSDNHSIEPNISRHRLSKVLGKNASNKNVSIDSVKSMEPCGNSAADTFTEGIYKKETSLKRKMSHVIDNVQSKNHKHNEMVVIEQLEKQTEKKVNITKQTLAESSTETVHYENKYIAPRKDDSDDSHSDIPLTEYVKESSKKKNEGLLQMDNDEETVLMELQDKKNIESSKRIKESETCEFSQGQTHLDDISESPLPPKRNKHSSQGTSQPELNISLAVNVSSGSPSLSSQFSFTLNTCMKDNKDKNLQNEVEKFIVGDSDDSHSDVPLTEYVKESSKKKNESLPLSEIEEGSIHIKYKNDKKKKSKRILDYTTDNIDNQQAEVSQEKMSSERFMENFGFFSERKPRKSNLLAAKKISETFNAISNDDIEEKSVPKVINKRQSKTNIQVSATKNVRKKALDMINPDLSHQCEVLKENTSQKTEAFPRAPTFDYNFPADSSEELPLEYNKKVSKTNIQVSATKNVRKKTLDMINPDLSHQYEVLKENTSQKTEGFPRAPTFDYNFPTDSSEELPLEYNKKVSKTNIQVSATKNVRKKTLDMINPDLSHQCEVLKENASQKTEGFPRAPTFDYNFPTDSSEDLPLEYNKKVSKTNIDIASNKAEKEVAKFSAKTNTLKFDLNCTDTTEDEAAKQKEIVPNYIKKTAFRSKVETTTELINPLPPTFQTTSPAADEIHKYVDNFFAKTKVPTYQFELNRSEFNEKLPVRPAKSKDGSNYKFKKTTRAKQFKTNTELVLDGPRNTDIGTNEADEEVTKLFETSTLPKYQFDLDFSNSTVNEAKMCDRDNYKSKNNISRKQVDSNTLLVQEDSANTHVAPKKLESEEYSKKTNPTGMEFTSDFSDSSEDDESYLKTKKSLILKKMTKGDSKRETKCNMGRFNTESVNKVQADTGSVNTVADETVKLIERPTTSYASNSNDEVGDVTTSTVKDNNASDNAELLGENESTKSSNSDSSNIDGESPSNDAENTIEISETYCSVCKKQYHRPDNLIRHTQSLFHVSNVSALDMNLTTKPCIEEPKFNYLVIYKKYMDNLKRRKQIEGSNVEVPTLSELLKITEVDKNGSIELRRNPERGLSQDQAIFVECCELLKVSHRSGDVSAVASTSGSHAFRMDPSDQDQPNVNSTVPVPCEGDVDPITAKQILESEEVRKLETDLLLGLKNIRTAPNSHLPEENNPSLVTNKATEKGPYDFSSGDSDDLRPFSERHQLSSKVKKKDTAALRSKKARKKRLSAKRHAMEKDELYDFSSKEIKPKSIKRRATEQETFDTEEVLKPIPSEKPTTSYDSLDLFEDKFDLIKRKCRSQAAAAKQLNAPPEASTSARSKRKAEKKSSHKKNKKHQCAVPTKGALKGFDGIKLPTKLPPTHSVAHSSSSDEAPPKKRKKRKQKDPSRKKNGSSKATIEKAEPQSRHDVYEFMDETNDNIDSTLAERFKHSVSDAHTSGMGMSEARAAEEPAVSASDDDDFVYMSDNYMCDSTNETEAENSVNYCISPTFVDNESITSNRRESTEKNTVMGKIFKNNAVRDVRRTSLNASELESGNDARNMDLVFDSLLEDTPAGRTNSTASGPRDRIVFKKKSLRPPDTPVVNFEKVYTSKKDMASDKCSASADGSNNTAPGVRNRIILKKKSSCLPYTPANFEEKYSSNNDMILDKSTAPGNGGISTVPGIENRIILKKKPRHRPHTPVVDFEETYPSQREMDEDEGVTTQRARRKCTVGKQNILVESWSSESDPDPRPVNRANRDDSLVKLRRKRTKKSKPSHCSRRIKFQEETEQGSSRSRSRSRAWPVRREKRSISEVRYYRSSTEDDVSHAPQEQPQHGWIVCESQKKLVTMLAHAKGRKHDSNKSLVE